MVGTAVPDVPMNVGLVLMNIAGGEVRLVVGGAVDAIGAGVGNIGVDVVG